MAKKKEKPSVDVNEEKPSVDVNEENQVNVVEQVENPGEFFAGLNMRTAVALRNPGTGIRGILLGETDPIEINDHDEVRRVRTWSIKTASGMVVRLMGATVLDSELQTIEPPARVAIVRGPDKVSGKNRIGMYQVAAGPATDEDIS
jgi:hypothetical protein